VDDVNREHTEVLQEVNINGIMDTSYTYGNERLTNERFTGEAAYYAYDPRGSVSGLTGSEGMLHQSYRYDPFGGIDFGKPQYNNVYAYNAQSYNGNTEHQYLRARYYDTDTADFITEDSYLGKITDPLTLNRYNYVKSSPLNYTDPSGHLSIPTERNLANVDHTSRANDSHAQKQETKQTSQALSLDELMELAEENGNYKDCVIPLVRTMLAEWGMNPEAMVSKFWFPKDIRKDFLTRIEEYERYLYGTKNIPYWTNEEYQIYLTVSDILTQSTYEGYTADQVTNDVIDKNFKAFLDMRVHQAVEAGWVLTSAAVSALASSLNNLYGKASVSHYNKGMGKLPKPGDPDFVGPLPPKKAGNITFTEAADSHLTTVDGFNKKKTGIQGGHSKEAFDQFAETRPINQVGETRYSDIEGLYEIDYQVAKLERGQPVAGEWVDSGKPYTKTLYDPQIISDDTMKALGHDALSDATPFTTPGGQTKVIGKTTYGGQTMKFEGWLNPNGSLKSYYPVLNHSN